MITVQNLIERGFRLTAQVPEPQAAQAERAVRAAYIDKLPAAIRNSTDEVIAEQVTAATAYLMYAYLLLQGAYVTTFSTPQPKRFSELASDTLRRREAGEARKRGVTILMWLLRENKFNYLPKFDYILNDAI